MQGSNVNIINGKRQYVMFDLQQLDKDIWYWDNAISCSDELVGFINDLDTNEDSYSAIPKWEPWVASNNSEIIYGSVKKISGDTSKINTGNNKVDQKCLYVINSLKMGIEMCYDRYMDGHKMDKSKYMLDTRIIPIKKWNEGQYMGPHVDGQEGNTELAFSIVTYLNDDYKGGEINFQNQNILVKPKPGSVIIFPSHEPFTHQVLEIKSGTRYMVATSVLKLS